MPTFNDTLQIMTGIRSRLGNPPASKLRNLDILIGIRQTLNSYRTWLKNVDQNYYWKVAEIQAVPSQADYPLPAGDFNKALTCEWINPAYPNDVGIEINIVNFQDMDKVVKGIVVPYCPWGVASEEFQDMARAISFRGLPPTVTVRITPTPRYSVTYRIYYQPSHQGNVQVNDALDFPPEHMTLIEVAGARSLVPNCGYDEATSNAYSRQLNIDLVRLERNFEWDKMQNKQQSARSSRPYIPGGGTGGWGNGYGGGY